MKKVYTADNLVGVMHMKNVLEMDGIECEVRNQFLAGAMGDVPPQDCWPQLWVRNDADVRLAQRLVSEHESPPPSDSPAWLCHRCGEHIEPQFSQCWQCGWEPPATT